ncbi:MAG: alpha/beta hydrolase [Clostridiales bacterium]|nr:alpha/beta hydrolase [Clostridiales bacterium]
MRTKREPDKTEELERHGQAEKAADDSDKKILRAVVIILIVAVVVAFGIYGGRRYVNDYYEATGIAEDALAGSDDVDVTETDDFYRFTPQEANGTGIVFYPGAKVEETAYAPMLLEFAESGYTVYLMRMPWHLAVLDIDAADAAIADEEGKEISHWILMGHSLGGSMAAKYIARHPDEFDGLVLLAAYSADDISDVDIEVLSIYGSDDGVLNLNKYENAKKNLPDGAQEFIIDGGNHAGYGNYGAQKGDNDAEISASEQQHTTVDRVLYWLDTN